MLNNFQYSSNRRPLRRHRRGAMIYMVLFVMVLLLVGALFSIDVAYMHMVRAELRTATDAAARAGAETLTRTQSLDAARLAAIRVASKNDVIGEGLELLASDIEIGHHVESGDRLLFESGAPFTAVRVIGTRADDQGRTQGSVPLFFGGIFGTPRFEPVQFATATSSVRDIALVLDRSGSMGTVTPTGTRLSALKNAVNDFLDEVTFSSPDSFLSLTTYSSTVTRDIALTEDFESIRDEVDSLVASGATAIGNALTAGSDSLIEDALQRSLASKTIVVMTDGNHNTGPNPSVTVATAIARGHTVHTVTFSSGADQNLMRNVAEQTGGLHFHADSEEELRTAFQEIAKALPVVLIE